ncbi:sugar phosphate isomerase/epimerase [Phytoactinopolyspora alkaliphila]|uniref:Sugar phosphate isomerase/epimerase n=1 Tax=Phytoactinopolyspora alkaliphila TaxID=1783498 RepID=A0A6N9YT68_9ACTN|nr:sugar phosphate isomerase/epimerase family protein [Phytoactinopolyspora alkaliphila]NED98172.1 sugar phosphate isomerase/epimerase [Phytoactinopolyspora alkaliphila]
MWTLSGFADEISPDLDEQCRVLNELGIGHIEFRSAWDTNVLDLDDDQLKAVAMTLATHGIRTSSIGSPIGKIGIRDAFDAHLARFERALHVAEFLEAPFVRIFSFFVPENDTPDAYRDEVLRRMSALAKRAQGHPVTLLHENEKEIYGDIPSRCLDIVESVGSPQLRLAWDAANFVQCGVRPHTEGYQMLRPYVDYIQIKDAKLADGTVVPAGEGDGEVTATVAALREDGFDGFFSMEPHLSAVGQFGGFSGPDLFAKATHAFTAILEDQGIDYR